MKRFFIDYGLSVVLAVLFAASWLLQGVTGWVEFASEQHSHQQVATLFGGDGYIWPWMQSTFENWQSEFLQLFTMAIFTAFLVHRGSSESPDSDAELRLMLTDIQDRLARIEHEGKTRG